MNRLVAVRITHPVVALREKEWVDTFLQPIP